MPKKTKSNDEVKFPQIEAVLCTDNEALALPGQTVAPAITADVMKDILGWEVIPPGAGKDMPKLLTDVEGNDIFCHNNDRNRPFDVEHAYKLAQEFLCRRFAPKGPNGETMIVGRTGRVLSAQHRGAGLILAQQMLDGPERDRWVKNWPDGVVRMETMLVRGIDESAETVRTLDNVRPRTFADVLFAEGTTFSAKKRDDREQLCKEMNRAIKELWGRVGLKKATDNPHGTYLTHSEALDFLRRHPKIKDAVEFVWTENKRGKGEEAPKGETRGKVEKFLPVGVAGALLYLMAQQDSDREKWLGSKAPGDRSLNWDNWDKAEEFFTLLANQAPEVEAVRLAKRRGTSDLIFVKGETGGTMQERRGVLIRAFQAFADGGKVTQKDISLKYAERDGEKVLDEFPTLGGIDIGGVVEKPVKEDTPEAKKLLNGDDPDEVERRKQQVKEEALAETRDDHPKNGRSATVQNGQARKGSKGRKKDKTEEEPAPVPSGDSDGDEWAMPGEGTEGEDD